jgi:hypothetical protein
MIVPFFASCDSGKTEGDTSENRQTEEIEETQITQKTEITTAATTEADTVVETELENQPSIPQKNYDDEFYLLIQPGSNIFNFHWVEKSENDVLSQAIFERQQKVHDHLGVKVIGIEAEHSSDYVEPFKNRIKNKDGSVDALLTHYFFGVDGFVSGNYLANYNDYPQIDLSADYWNSKIMEDISIDGEMFLGKSDFNILCAYVVMFNKDMMEKYGDELDETVYEMVDNYHWTLDKMISLANLVYIDTTGDGKTMDDTFGIAAEQDAAANGFLLSSDISIIAPDDSGNYVITVYNDINKEKTTNVVEKLHELSKSNFGWFWPWAGDYPIEFQKGTALMTWMNTNKLPDYLDYDLNFGVLPYPMYDENQKDVGYRSLQYGGFIGIPTYLRNSQMVGDTLEMLAYYSENVNTAYYEKLLGKQVADTTHDSRMLQIVWDGIGTDFAQTFYGSFESTDFFHMMARLTPADATQSVAAFVKSKEAAVTKRLGIFLDKVRNRK